MTAWRLAGLLTAVHLLLGFLPGVEPWNTVWLVSGIALIASVFYATRATVIRLAADGSHS